MMNNWIKKQKSLLTLTSSSSSEAISNSVDENSKYTAYVNDDAALDSFKSHWMMAWQIMQTKSMIPSINLDQSNDGDHSITADDVTTIINHIEQIIALLVQENQKFKILNSKNESTPIMMSPLLDYLLMESVLDKIFNWSSNIGEYTDLMKLEQLKLYELLVSQLCHESTMLFQTALIRPLLHLLSTCKDCAPLEVEKRLVQLLNTLCVVLSENTDLLELFFVSDKNKNNITCTMEEVKSSPQLKNKLSYLDNPESRFLIFSLLISFVHREGSIGRQARDSLLLIMSLSKTHPSIGIYIAENSNFCPVLATGLSGLYSLLPRKLVTEVMSANDWHQLTNEDINEIGELQTFLNSLVFCNEVIKVSHPLVKQQLLEYISQGFLNSVIAPALHQDIMQFPIEVLETYPKFQNTIEEIIATTAYLELCLRTVTQPDLLKVFLKFIFTESFDGQRILDTLTTRIACYKKLSLVTIVLFKTLLDLNCEDVLTELVFKYLLRLDFLSERTNQQVERILDSSRLDQSARRLLNYIPIDTKVQQSKQQNKNILEKLDSLNFDNSFMSTETTESSSFCSLFSCDYLMQNYVDYLNDAHQSIRNCIKGTANWSRYSEYQLEEIYERFNHCEEKENQPNNANTNKVNCKNNNCLNNIASSDLPCEEYHFDKNFNHETQLIGSFLSNLFNKLENFLNNDIYTNLQLTGLISRLVIYPQPILRSFFFNDSLQINPQVRTIWKILPKLKYKLEKQLEKIENYDELIESAKEYFENREKILLNDENDDKFLNRNKLNRSPSLQSEKIIINIEPKDNKKKTIRDFWNRLRNDRSSTIVQKQEIEYVNSKRSSSNKSGYLMKNLSENQSIVLSILIFMEFIKEISSICLEHYLKAL